MILHLLIFSVILIIITSPLSSSAKANCTRVCGSGGRETRVEYPFGFTSGCGIPLNCSEDGNIQVGGYSVQNLTRDNIDINFRAKCDRQFEEIRLFSGSNFALTSENELLLENCNSLVNNCMVPRTIVENHLNLRQCNSSMNRSMNCYSEDNADQEEIMNLKRLETAGCKVLFSSVTADLNGASSKSSPVSLEGQSLQLGWWVQGDCKCHRNAVCRNVLFENMTIGYRCHCNEGRDGDGFVDGDGCHRGSALPLTMKIVIGFSSIISIVGMILMYLVLHFCRRKRSQGTLEPATANHQLEIFIKDYGTLAPKRYTYSEIKKMQNLFQEELGRGGYGSVYKGQLHNGSLVAVKLLNGSVGEGEDFINEVASISKTSHVNIVSLLGFCVEGNKKALIYEFMPNGSLDKFLREDDSHLDWNTLFKIAKGIARGLEYLHQGCNTRIVHFDIKPHNILLDEEFVPKISDFGLAKLCKRKESILSSMGARGTAGYMGPEVFFKSLGGASHKSDVYSYGMMVLEMTGARKNNNASPTSASEAYFPDWIYNQVEAGDNLGVYGVTNEDEDKLARKMVTVSLWCIQYHPSDRPSISKVVEMLEGSLESLQVSPRRFWSSPTRPIKGTSSSATQSSTGV